MSNFHNSHLKQMYDYLYYDTDMEDLSCIVWRWMVTYDRYTTSCSRRSLVIRNKVFPFFSGATIG